MAYMAPEVARVGGLGIVAEKPAPLF
eukprot:SAG11_NODE_27314_length_334_cov_0.659574_1_plen_25_part_01